MNILIVEDEKLAFERLNRLLLNSDIYINKITHSTSVEQSIIEIRSHMFDLGFFDIELSDGLSFNILKQTKIQFPIIFTTAYNQYAIEAFKHNSVDYLLKPIDKKDLTQALGKYKKYWNKEEPKINSQQLLNDFKKLLQDNYKKRFTVKVGEHIRIIETKDIQLVYSQNKGTYLRTSRDTAIDYSLDKIQEDLSPKEFFRISRKYIVSIHFIKDIIAFSNSRLKIVLDPSFDEDLIVSREKVQEFKKWLLM